MGASRGVWPRTVVSHLWGRGRGTALSFFKGLPDPWSHVLYDLQKIGIQVQHISNQGLAIVQDQALICEQNEASAYDHGQGSVCILVSFPDAVIKFPRKEIVFTHSSRYTVHHGKEVKRSGVSSSW